MSILFLSDYRKRAAYIHPTKNQSAIRIAMLLKRMGIQNYQFMLTTYDKDLLHVDPWDYKSLTQELAEKIFIEARRNIWYFLREVVRIPITGSDPIPYCFHRGNLALTFNFMNDIDSLLTIPRQNFKTMSTQAIMAHLMYFSGYNQDIISATKDSALQIDNTLRLRELAMEGIPAYLITRNAKGVDKDAKEGLSYTCLSNRYMTAINANTVAGANKIGRGMTVPVIHIDEIAFFRYIDITYPAMMAATIQAAADARDAGKRCANIHTTTAGRPDEDSGRFSLGLANKACLFNDKMYDAKDQADYESIIRSNSVNKDSLMVYICYSFLQLGRTKEWARGVIGKLNAPSIDVILRDLFNEWVAGSDAGVIPSGLLTKMNESIIDPHHIELDQGFMFRWYVPEEYLDTLEFKNKPLVIGLDSSDSIGNDFTAAIVVDPTTGATVGTLRSNDTNIINMARYLAGILSRFPNSVLVPESRSSGRAIIDLIIDDLLNRGENPWKRIYNSAVQKLDETEFKNFNIYSESADGVNRRLFGYATTSGNGVGSRNYLYKTVMMKALQLNHSRLHDQILCREFSSLTMKNGRIDHQTSGHDDLAVAYLLANFLIFFGKNLHVYGITKDIVLHSVSSDGTLVDPKLKEQQAQIQKQIEQLETALMRCPPSNITKYNYMRQLKSLQDRIDDTISLSAPITRSDLAEEARRESGAPMGLREENVVKLMTAVF